MSKADKMFEKLGFIKAKKPHELKPTFNDYYSEDDEVYEYYHEGRLTCRLYFIESSSERVYSYQHDGNTCVETNMEEHLAIHQKLAEKGWIRYE